jgi:group I intron endonuclease
MGSFWVLNMRISGIYSIHNLLNGKRYIGSSINVKKRWEAHRDQLKRKIHHSILLQRAWDKYGKEAFEFSILEEVEPIKEKIEFHEQSYLYLFNPKYNVSPKVGRSFITPEKRAEISLKFSGECHPFFGKKRPYHSEFMRGPNSSFRGKKHKEETKIKSSESKTLLTKETALKAKEMLISGKTQVQIAAFFGVSHSVINRLFSNKILAYIGFSPDGVDKKEVGRIANCGINNYRSKVTEQQVIDMRRMRHVERMKIRKIAKIMNMNENTVGGIVNYKTYSNISASKVDALAAEIPDFEPPK